jgi:hypothetical protein
LGGVVSDLPEKGKDLEEERDRRRGEGMGERGKRLILDRLSSCNHFPRKNLGEKARLHRQSSKHVSDSMLQILSLVEREREPTY